MWCASANKITWCVSANAITWCVSANEIMWCVSANAIKWCVSAYTITRCVSAKVIMWCVSANIVTWCVSANIVTWCVSANEQVVIQAVITEILQQTPCCGRNMDLTNNYFTDNLRRHHLQLHDTDLQAWLVLVEASSSPPFSTISVLE